MIVHNIDIRESGPDGLIAILEPHAEVRSPGVETHPVYGSWASCAVQDCTWDADGEMTVHRRHSKRLEEAAYICDAHLTAHQLGETLRLVVESNR